MTKKNKKYLGYIILILALVPWAWIVYYDIKDAPIIFKNGDEWTDLRTGQRIERETETFEDPLHRWRQLQEERAAGKEAALDCESLAKKIEAFDENSDDPLRRWHALRYERDCKQKAEAE